MRVLIVCMLIATTLAGCAEAPTYTPFEPSSEPPQAAPEVNETIEVVEAPVENATEPLRFLLIGDQGTGGDGQYAVAAVMEQVCLDQGCDFVMTMGDNIYEYGATSAYDTQFEEKFEQPYANIDAPFYLSLGNHDNGGLGTFQSLGEFQVDYHYRTDRTSDKWNMPERYYSQRFGNDLEIFALDSDCIQRDDASVTDCNPEDQQAWLRENIDASDANWKFAFGHYNYISNGNYGDGSSGFKAALENSVCDRVQFYMQGHDHDLQWLKPVESCGKTEFIGSSAAGKQRSVDPDWEFDARFGIGDTLGFAWAEIVGDELTVEFWDSDSNMLYRETVTKQQLGW